MTYPEFKLQICESIQKELGADIKVTIQDIVKNNDTHHEGLTFLSNRYNISPTIYLSYHYHQYEKGKAFPDIVQDILHIYHENCPKENIDISFFTDYDKVKSRITFKLINYERNKQLLSAIPHFRFLDLAIVFNCLLESCATGNATILIYNHHLNFWGITKDDLYALAISNTPRLLKYELRNMSDVLGELFSDEDLCSLCSDTNVQFPMYVLSNQHKLNGSNCILYHNLLKKFADRLGCDLFILPSSIHEVLIIPASNDTTYQELSAMVQEVNRTQLSREEILSDHVYYFSREDGHITM